MRIVSRVVERTCLRVVNPYADAAKCLSARVSAAQGKLDEAEPLFKESLAIKKKVFGDEHPSVATGLNNLALLLYHQQKYNEAKTYMEQALNIRAKVLGPDHPKTKSVEGSLEVIKKRC